MDFTIKKGSTEYGKVTHPDLDGQEYTVSPEEAAKLVVTLSGPSPATKTVKDLLADPDRSKLVFEYTKDGKRKTVGIKFFEDLVKAYELSRVVQITIPAETEITPLAKKGVKKPEDNDLNPLKERAGETLTFQIKVPEGHDWHQWTPELSERLMTAIDDASEYSAEFKSALKIAARNGTLGPKLIVKLGFAETNLQKVLGEADVRKAEKDEAAEGGEGEGETSIPHTDDPAFSGFNFVNAVSSFHAAISFVSRLASRLSELCDSLIIALAGGDVDALAMLMDVQAGVENILASKSGIETARNKGKLRAQIEKLRRKNEETQGKYRKLLAEVNQNPKDSAKAAKLAELESISKKTEYLIQDAQAFLQVMDQFVNSQLQAGQDAQRIAQTIRYKLDGRQRG